MRRVLLLALPLLGGCIADDWDEMELQPKALPYRANGFFDDDRVMRQPPPGTVPRSRRGKSRLLVHGRELPDAGYPDAGYLEELPLPVTRDLLERGKHSYEIYCGTCHGLLGDGKSWVARNMALRPPPSLHTLPEYPDGYYYTVISEGFGLMPGYAGKLAPEERWAVVAYVRALQLSQRAGVADVPPEVRPMLLKEGTP